MYGQKMFAEDRVSPNYDLFGDGDLQLLQCPPSQLYTQQQQQQQPQPWSLADNLGPAKSSNTMLSRFKSPTSAFYAVEELMGFQQNRCQVSSTHQNGCLNADFPAATKILPQRQNMLPIDDAAFAWRRVADKIQEYKVSSNSYSHHVPQLSFSNSQQEKQSPKFSSSATTFGPVLPNKTRIRWTPDLHEKFVACVNRLGGADKATPKAILKLMGSDGLTIFHIKSHLQKYRIAKYIPESAEGRSDRRTSMNDVTRLDVKNGLQIKEALQLQLDVQRQLHEQLEIQRNLQLRIEEQGRQLKMMFNQQQQQQSTKALLRNNNQDEKSVEDDDIFSIIDGSDNSYFHSKIS